MRSDLLKSDRKVCVFSLSLGRTMATDSLRFCADATESTAKARRDKIHFFMVRVFTIYDGMFAKIGIYGD